MSTIFVPFGLLDIAPCSHNKGATDVVTPSNFSHLNSPILLILSRYSSNVTKKSFESLMLSNAIKGSDNVQTPKFPLP